MAGNCRASFVTQSVVTKPHSSHTGYYSRIRVSMPAHYEIKRRTRLTYVASFSLRTEDIQSLRGVALICSFC